MEEFLKFYNENNTKKINVIYDDKTTRRETGICDYEYPSNATYYMYCEAINEIGVEVGGLAEFNIVKGHYMYIKVLCTNKKPYNKEYTHDGAATILLNIFKKYVDFEKKEYPSFYFLLWSVDDAREYYLRQNLQTSDNNHFSYGENTKTLRKILSPTQKELLLLRGDDDGTLAEKLTSAEKPTSAKKQFRKEKMKSTRKSRRLNPKKRYDYTFRLFIDQTDYERTQVPRELGDGNNLFECILL